LATGATERVTTTDSRSSVICVEIGKMAVEFQSPHPRLREILEDRYGGFSNPEALPDWRFAVDVIDPLTPPDPDQDLEVANREGVWRLRRGDFFAEINPCTRQGWIRQSANPYSLDSFLRIVHTLTLAKTGGFLLHAASAIRNGKAFLFSGVSGAGKTTISRHAPPDATLLTDEISYLRPAGSGYEAYGTPFAGELARVGENQSAPVATLFFLVQGPENRIEPVDSKDAIRLLLRNILFFAQDRELVTSVFESACNFVKEVSVQKLVFLPDSRVWDLIG
jgi:hypothetical protein